MSGGRRQTPEQREAAKLLRMERVRLARTPDGIVVIRRQVLRVVEHWAEQKGVDVSELLFRLHAAPLKPEDPTWDPIGTPRAIG